MQEILEKTTPYETISSVSNRLKFALMLISVGRIDEGLEMIVHDVERLDDLLEELRAKSH